MDALDLSALSLSAAHGDADAAAPGQAPAAPALGKPLLSSRPSIVVAAIDPNHPEDGDEHLPVLSIGIDPESNDFPDLGPRDVHPWHAAALPSHDAMRASPHYPVFVTANPMAGTQASTLLLLWLAGCFDLFVCCSAVSLFLRCRELFAAV
jgi:hypothetical protein